MDGFAVVVSSVLLRFAYLALFATVVFKVFPRLLVGPAFAFDDNCAAHCWLGRGWYLKGMGK